MDSPQEVSQIDNRKIILPWKIIHPETLHAENQPHVNVISLSKFHCENGHRWKKYFQIGDLFLVQISLTLFILPMLVRQILRLRSEITIEEFNCLTLSAYYKKHFGEIINENFSSGI